MDPDALEEATDRWVAAGLIDEETAAAIRAFEAGEDSSGATRRRLVWLLGLMGAVLVGAGILVFLATWWDELPTAMRTAVLSAAPLTAAGAGVWVRSRHLPQVGHALWLLGALLLGPAVFGIAELHAPGLDPAWRFLIWGIVALPMGHAFPSSLVVVVGLVALLAAGGSVSTGADGWFVIGLLGGVIGAARIPTAQRDPDRAPVYEVVAAATGIGLFLFVSASEGRFDRIDLLWEWALIAAAVLAGVAMVGVSLAVWSAEVRPRDASLGLVPSGAAAFLAVLVTLGDGINWLFAHLLAQAGFLAYVLAIAVAGVWLGSRWLVNLGALGFLLLVLVNLVLLAGELTGAVALVVAGGTLVLAAVVLERGRRAFLERLERR